MILGLLSQIPYLMEQGIFAKEQGIREQRAITATQSETTWCPPQSDVELITEKNILGFQPASRLEQISETFRARAGSQTSP